MKHLKKIFEQAIRSNLPLVCSNPDILGVSGEKIHPSTGDLANSIIKTWKENSYYR